MHWKMEGAPERKYHQPDKGLTVVDGTVVAGYASLFGLRDQGGDVGFDPEFPTPPLTAQRLQVRNLHYAVHLGDLLLAEGDFGQWFRVDGHARRVIEVPVRTNLWRQLKPIAKLLKRPDQAIPYRLEGELKTGLFIGYDVQVNHNGEIIPGDFIPERHR